MRDKIELWLTNHILMIPYLVIVVFTFFINLEVGAKTVTELLGNYLKALSMFSFYYSLLIITSILYSYIKHKLEEIKPNLVALCIVFAISSPYIPKLLGYGTTQIGDYYEKDEYTENYVVFMSREPQKNENRKVYTLTAKINSIYGCYYIQKLYFNNEGYLNFDEVDSILEPNEEYSVEDNKGDTYYITLTKQKGLLEVR